MTSSANSLPVTPAVPAPASSSGPAITPVPGTETGAFRWTLPQNNKEKVEKFELLVRLGQLPSNGLLSSDLINIYGNRLFDILHDKCRTLEANKNFFNRKNISLRLGLASETLSETKCEEIKACHDIITKIRCLQPIDLLLNKLADADEVDNIFNDVKVNLIKNDLTVLESEIDALKEKILAAKSTYQRNTIIQDWQRSTFRCFNEAFQTKQSRIGLQSKIIPNPLENVSGSHTLTDAETAITRYVYPEHTPCTPEQLWLLKEEEIGNVLDSDMYHHDATKRKRMLMAVCLSEKLIKADTPIEKLNAVSPAALREARSAYQVAKNTLQKASKANKPKLHKRIGRWFKHLFSSPPYNGPGTELATTDSEWSDFARPYQILLKGKSEETQLQASLITLQKLLTPVAIQTESTPQPQPLKKENTTPETTSGSDEEKISQSESSLSLKPEVGAFSTPSKKKVADQNSAFLLEQEVDHESKSPRRAENREEKGAQKKPPQVLDTNHKTSADELKLSPSAPALEVKIQFTPPPNPIKLVKSDDVVNCFIDFFNDFSHFFNDDIIKKRPYISFLFYTIPFLQLALPIYASGAPFLKDITTFIATMESAIAKQIGLTQLSPEHIQEFFAGITQMANKVTCSEAGSLEAGLVSTLIAKLLFTAIDLILNHKDSMLGEKFGTAGSLEAEHTSHGLLLFLRNGLFDLAKLGLSAYGVAFLQTLPGISEVFKTIADIPLEKLKELPQTQMETIQLFAVAKASTIFYMKAYFTYCHMLNGNFVDFDGQQIMPDSFNGNVITLFTELTHGTTEQRAKIQSHPQFPKLRSHFEKLLKINPSLWPSLKQDDGTYTALKELGVKRITSGPWYKKLGMFFIKLVDISIKMTLGLVVALFTLGVLLKSKCSGTAPASLLKSPRSRFFYRYGLEAMQVWVKIATCAWTFAKAMPASALRIVARLPEIVISTLFTAASVAALGIFTGLCLVAKTVSLGFLIRGKTYVDTIKSSHKKIMESHTGIMHAYREKVRYRAERIIDKGLTWFRNLLVRQVQREIQVALPFHSKSPTGTTAILKKLDITSTPHSPPDPQALPIAASVSPSIADTPSSSRDPHTPPPSPIASGQPGSSPTLFGQTRITIGLPATRNRGSASEEETAIASGATVIASGATVIASGATVIASGATVIHMPTPDGAVIQPSHTPAPSYVKAS